MDRDAQAVDRLYRRYSERLRRYVFPQVGRAGSEDVVHTIFLRIWRRRGQHDVHRITSSYLFRAALDEARHRIERGERLSRLKLRLSRTSHRTPPTPLEEVEAKGPRRPSTRPGFS